MLFFGETDAEIEKNMRISRRNGGGLMLLNVTAVCYTCGGGADIVTKLQPTSRSIPSLEYSFSYSKYLVIPGFDRKGIGLG